MIIPYLSSTKNSDDGLMLNGVIFDQILAFPIAPWLCGHTGRRFPSFIGSLLLVIGAILHCAAQDFAMFLVSLMIVGFGGLIAVEPWRMLVSELGYLNHRSVLCNDSRVGDIWNLLHGSGCIMGLAHPPLLQGLFPLLQVLVVYLLPESPRHLVRKDRHEDARKGYEDVRKVLVK
ncbi:uncharacterized protein N7458_003665 [Penicillium daleae]|uniref:Major facilitator superfamily (MFS) profile domain-containing protein n=1 Tax=Penicillium daleae TaxID=63821 RepID=A0AAD6G8G0_9EURO|nr:uncharacterized protein N7458_003665 [Penicillium daleae]KAJ5462113.1 hypothetical protein N7458_003665 [Penicillium daleae]